MSRRPLTFFKGSALVAAAIATVASLYSPPCSYGGIEHDATFQMADSLWIEDLDYLTRELPARHKNLFFSLPEEDFYRMVDDLRSTIPTLTDYEIVVGIMEILAEVGDPHTVAGITHTNFFSRLPLVMEWYADGLFVVETSPEEASVLGRRVRSMGGHPVEEVHRQISRVIPGRNQALLKQRGPQYMVFPEIMAALGIIENPHTLVFDFDSLGEYPVRAIPFSEKTRRITVLDTLKCGLPLYLKHPDQYYWFTYVDRSSLLYIQYDSCTEMKHKPFAQFTEEVLAAIDSLPVEKLVFDMRSNGGGNSSLAGPLISAIKARPEVNRKGRLFIIIGRETFSSAILNTLEFMEGGSAILVGEPTGGKPNGYGEVRFFILPHSMIPIQYSTKYFRLCPGDPPTVSPDIEVDVSFEDLVSCRDPALEAILKYEAAP